MVDADDHRRNAFESAAVGCCRGWRGGADAAGTVDFYRTVGTWLSILCCVYRTCSGIFRLFAPTGRIESAARLAPADCRTWRFDDRHQRTLAPVGSAIVTARYPARHRRAARCDCDQ